MPPPFAAVLNAPLYKGDDLDQGPVPQLSLCLFDLDQTLLRTDDLERFRGSAHVGENGSDYVERLRAQYHSRADRMLYSTERLTALREQFPELMWGVFTRSPRQYAEILLDAAYPRIRWDCVLAYEDVQSTKPSGEGVKAAMAHCRIEDSAEVILVGDSREDILAGYNGRCWTVLDRHSWEQPRAKQHVPALELVPDAVIDDPAMLGDCLANPALALPELEYRLAFDTDARTGPRFDWINHYDCQGRERVLITVLGRYFTRDAAPYRHPLTGDHVLSEQILRHKSTRRFPTAWIEAIRAYLARTCKEADPVVTVMPFKPGRPPRLEALLAQVALTDRQAPIRPGTRYTFEPAVLSFEAGAVSAHKNFLNKQERFENATRTLRVTAPDAVRGRQVIVFDDVVTTGASFFAAYRVLKRAGASKVCCMALAKTVNRRRS